jgi:hypothetical protein
VDRVSSLGVHYSEGYLLQGRNCSITLLCIPLLEDVMRFAPDPKHASASSSADVATLPQSSSAMLLCDRSPSGGKRKEVQTCALMEKARTFWYF